MKVPYGASTDQLRDLVRSSPPDKWAAFEALAHAADSDSLSLLVELARSEDPHVRRAAVDAIGKRPDATAIAETVTSLLDDANEFVVRAACGAAANLMLLEAHARIRALACSPSAATRQASVSALFSLWTDSDFDAIEALFRTDPSSDVRFAAAFALRENASAPRAPRLFALWRSDPTPRHRTWACEIAAQFPDRAFAPELEELSRDRDGHVRAAAARALAAQPEAV